MVWSAVSLFHDWGRWFPYSSRMVLRMLEPTTHFINAQISIQNYIRIQCAAINGSTFQQKWIISCICLSEILNIHFIPFHKMPTKWCSESQHTTLITDITPTIFISLPTFIIQKIPRTYPHYLCDYFLPLLRHSSCCLVPPTAWHAINIIHSASKKWSINWWTPVAVVDVVRWCGRDYPKCEKLKLFS